MAAILMLLPGLWIAGLGVLIFLGGLFEMIATLPQPLEAIVASMVLLSMFAGFIYLMVRFKTFRKVILITAIIVTIGIFTKTIGVIWKIVESVITFAFILIYWFLIRD